VAFSYETLVESGERFESDSDDDDDDDDCKDDLAARNGHNPSPNPNSIPNEASDGVSVQDIDRGNQDWREGYFGSAVEIFGLREEVAVTGASIQRERDRKVSLKSKRRVYSGAKANPSPSDPMARLVDSG
jgi:hypothetical protein